MRVAILGPLEVSVDGQPVTLAGGRLRATLIRLAISAPQAVPVDSLIEAVWADQSPADEANALQALVSRLRRALGGAETVVAEADGYRLNLERADVDANVFRDHVQTGQAQARAGRPAQALQAFDQALGLWRGPALSELTAFSFAPGLAADLDHLRLDAQAGRIAAALELGRAEDVVTELQRLLQDHPYREDFAAQLITALARTGRTGEAVELYETVRRRLADQLGTDPGPELQALQLALLRGELEPRRPLRRRLPTNLGAAMTSFVGRRDELERVRTSIDRQRLTTIVGPGGAGKTRLATEVARGWLTDPDRSAWLVELAPVDAESGLLNAVLAVLGLLETRVLERPERPFGDDHERLLDALRDLDGLLVIDNCEHLISAVAELVDDIVAAAPGIRVLATSREPLGLTGESLVPIPPLALPPVGASVDQAADYPAVRLFCDRAAAVSPDFVLDARAVPDVVTIVRRLDGLPLAIELAVARLRVLPVAEIAQRLSDRFRLLTGGNRTSLPRHRTLRAVVDWSWELLTDHERVLAERLAVFPSGVNEQTAAATCADSELPAGEIGDLLITLTEKSLLQALPTSPVRYRMLETIREYGIERLAEQNRLDEARTRHAEHFATMIIDAEPALRSAGQLEALAAIRLEEGNIVAARRFLLDSGRLHQALMMTLAGSWLTMITGNARELGWLEQVIDAHDGVDEPYLVYLKALRTLAGLGEGDEPFSWQAFRPTMLALYEQIRDAPPTPFPSLAAMTSVLPVYAGLTGYAEQAMSEALESPDPWVRAVVHASAAAWAENMGDSDRVRSEVKLAEEEFRATGDRWGIATVTGTRAGLRTLDGDAEGALRDLREAIEATEELRAADDTRYLRMRAAGVLIQLRRIDEARRELELLRETGERPGRPAQDEELMIDAMLVTGAWVEGDRERALTELADLRKRIIDRDQETLMSGHSTALGLSCSAMILTAAADQHPERLTQALDDLRLAYPAAVRTEDMPIVSQLGLGLAQAADLLDRPEEAAEILGAAARLRGGDADVSPMLSEFVEQLRRRLGDRYDDCYRVGRAMDRMDAVARMDPDRLAPAS